MSALRDLISNVKLTQLLAPAVLTSDQNSGSVDTRGFGSLLLSANVGASGDTLSGSVKIELEVEESDDNSTWNDVADTDLQGTVVAGSNPGTFAVIDDPAEDDALFKIGYIGAKRYVRVVANLTGTHTNGTPIGITAVQGRPSLTPTS